MVLVEDQVLLRAQECPCKLIMRCEIVKTVQWRGILYSGIMGVKRDEIADTHLGELLERIGTVQGFPSVAPVLSALVQERHDHTDAVGFSVCRSYDTLQILIVVVRGHVVCVTVHFVCQAVIAHIDEDEKIFSAHGLLQNSLSLAAVEAGRVESEEIVLFCVTLKSGIIDVYVVDLAAKVHKIIVDLISKFRGAVEDQQFERGHGHGIFKLFQI